MRSGSRSWDCQKWRKEHPDPPWICFFCEEEIWMKGQTSESLAMHHPDESRRVVPTHYRCHNANHPHSANGHAVPKKVKEQISSKLKGRPAPAVSAANKRRVAARYDKLYGRSC